MQRIYVDNVEGALQQIIPYLEDRGSGAHKAIYFDGWDGLGASAVLRAIAEDPPLSLRKKFDKIIHVDCSRWKNQRALQRAVAEELKLPQQVMAVFDRQDEEDDFSGVDEGSRAEIEDITREIFQTIWDLSCLVIFHKGSGHTVDIGNFGFPQHDWFSPKDNRVLWTFRGRLRLNQEIQKRVDNSHLYIYDNWRSWKHLLSEEAKEIARYTQHKRDINPEIAVQCCLYLLSLNYKEGDIMGYNWATHASSYWVCDGIIQHEDEDEAWEIGAALHKEIILEDYSSNKLPAFGYKLQTPQNRWVSEITYSNSQGQIHIATVQPETSSFFLAIKSKSDHPVSSLPNNMFQQSKKLRVIKLSWCTFSFSSPPFYCCQSLRFLGLDSCKDQRQEQAPKQQQEAEKKPGRPELEFFQSLWVLDICNTDWGRNIAWRRLQMLHKLRITETTSSWETGQKDEFTNMGKLELLDLSRSSTMQFLPGLSGATGLKTLVLDGCVALELVGPEGLPPSLESFSLDAGAKVSRISLAGCARLLDFLLRGPLPNLEELDLLDTAVKTLDLKSEVVHVPCLQKIILLGCEQLRSILWPKKGMQQLRMLCIDTRGGEEVRKLSPGALVHQLRQKYCHAYVAIMDMKFVQSLVLRPDREFYWITNRFNLALCISATSEEDRQRCNKEKMGRCSTGLVTGQPLHKLLIPNTSCSAYMDVTIDKITTDHDDSSASQFQQLDRHLEIGEGISNTNVESLQGIEAVVQSLHVHDNSSITTIIPQPTMPIGEGKQYLTWRCLNWCRVERCPKLHNVFATNYDFYCFEGLQMFWAADLPTAHCIWSKGRMVPHMDSRSFAKLRSIHLHSCPRLVFVLPLSWNNLHNSYLPELETLHIVYCGDLKQVFPVEAEFLNKIATDPRKGVLKFPKLKHIYLHELPSLEQICEAKMSTPMLETVRVRGCWSLRRLPDVDTRHTVDYKDWWNKLDRDGEDVGHDISLSKPCHPVVDCERNWWEKLEWDGLEAFYDPSLFKPCHSQFYKKALRRGSVLR